MKVNRISLFLFLIFSAPPLWGGAPTSTEKAIKSFAAEDFLQAVTAFAEAEKESPTDLRITYNLGVSLAASGNFPDAVATLRKSALAKDAELAAQSLTLIGDIAVVQARLLFVPKPGETPSQDRTTIFGHLTAAEVAYAEAMELKPLNVETLRRNIEQIRSWKIQAESDWNLADRKKKRQELHWPQRFDWLEQWERRIRTDLKQMVSEPDSPKKFQALYEAFKEQQRFLEELPPLKDSLRQNLPEESASQYVSATSKIGETATAANDALREMRISQALDSLTATIERLDFMKAHLSPFETIVQDATTKQETLCEANLTDIDFDEQAWEQDFVTVRMPLMLGKAKQESSKDSPQAENLHRAKELAIEYAPEIELLANEAAELLREKNPEAALSKQERALELLREILKQFQQNQDQDQDQQQNQQQKESESDNSEQQQNQNDSEAKEENQPSPEKKSSDGQEQSHQNKKEELEKAQRMLRQVRRWQQAADERREEVRALLIQMEPVDKDW